MFPTSSVPRRGKEVQSFQDATVIVESEMNLGHTKAVWTLRHGGDILNLRGLQTLADCVVDVGGGVSIRSFLKEEHEICSNNRKSVHLSVYACRLLNFLDTNRVKHEREVGLAAKINVDQLNENLEVVGTFWGSVKETFVSFDGPWGPSHVKIKEKFFPSLLLMTLPTSDQKFSALE